MVDPGAAARYSADNYGERFRLGELENPDDTPDRTVHEEMTDIIWKATMAARRRFAELLRVYERPEIFSAECKLEVKYLCCGSS